MLCSKVIEILKRWEEGHESMHAAEKRVSAAERSLGELLGPLAARSLLTLLQQDMKTCVTCETSKPEGVMFGDNCLECESQSRARELAQ